MTTLRAILTAQHKYTVMAEHVAVQRRRLSEMPSDTPGYKRQVQHIARIEQELNEFLDTEI